MYMYMCMYSCYVCTHLHCIDCKHINNHTQTHTHTPYKHIDTTSYLFSVALDSVVVLG